MRFWAAVPQLAIEKKKLVHCHICVLVRQDVLFFSQVFTLCTAWKKKNILYRRLQNKYKQLQNSSQDAPNLKMMP